ncbi:MAG: Flp pilus assembly complex ATPase component TadA [Candidatus Omnitrophica bacterium]|nr:Flp pilus assembly complex ATPase component TadA [Candidatus Omnitrophota bacterium]MBU4479361.1 Flp pilus assembly complex ATPase component TadA [Candidatus Omnitrophota bacterium]MCG2703837.1 Flp pilus assembly complex ATPase component TadA [Candidatus Omnitrophota bacterium]
MSGNFRFKTIGDILKERGLISQKELDEGLDHQRVSGLHLGQILVNLGYLSEEELFHTLGIQAKMETVDLEDMVIPRAALEKIPGSIARIYNIVPLSYEFNTLTIATSDPLNFGIFDDLRFMFNCNIKGKVATQSSILNAIRKHYGTEANSVEEIFSEISQNAPDLMEETEKIENIEELASQLPIIKLINLIFIQAIKKRASDIHFEPFQEEFKIRYRLDGVLYDVVNPPKALHLAITSRLKVMANLNIAETRLPQDGRMLVKIGGRMIDLRLSTLPTIFGESVVVRVLDKATVRLSLDDLGLEDDTKAKMRVLIKKPYGIILSTGPTGCGKTTAQYSALNEINKIECKIISVEDPVEFDLPGLIQVSVRPKINLTFPLALRHILRQDPDIIMVGEIRDAETVQMAIHASLTGHLVFSTLHTNDAPSAITRLIDMGVEPFLIASAVEAILAQRLLRCICEACRQEYVPSPKELKETGLTHSRIKDKKLFKGRGCENCNGTGYHGRIGIFELLVLDEDLRFLILDKSPVSALRAQAIKNGMVTLREDGLKKVFSGKTTLEELISITSGYV